MRKIGYIHRYDRKEEKGILVYGYNKDLLRNSPAPILFSKSQCKTSVKTGVLVYFEIDEDGTVRDIEYASIFNFDKELLLSYASVYDTKAWNECEKETHICYQNIFEQEDFFSHKEKISLHKEEDVACVENAEFDDVTNEHGDESGKVFDREAYDFDEELGVLDWDLYEDEDESDEDFDEVLAVIDRDEIALDDDQTVIIDILNPSLWIPLIPKSRKNYYGKNESEVENLFEILVAKRRRSHEEYLSKCRRSKCELQNLSIGMQRVSYPELFQDDCVSPAWTRLLNRLSFTEIKNIYCSYPLLQPVLPEAFCEEYLDILSEDYGFPSVTIAEKYLRNAIRHIHTSIEYSYYKRKLHTIKNCIARHLPNEGIPFCAIDRKKLGNITISLGIKQKAVINYVQNQISEANPELPLELMHSLTANKDLLLQIGEFYDFVRELPKKTTKSYFLDFRLKELKEKYQEIPDTAHIFLDTYLGSTLSAFLIDSIKSGELSPYNLHLILEELSKWIDSSFLSTHLNLIESIFSKTNNVSDLKDAFEYKYIQESTFIQRYYELAVDRSDEQCLKDLCEWWKNRYPEELQLYILRRVLKHYDLQFTYCYGDKDYDFPYDVKVRSLNDFLKWMNENTYDNEDRTGYILDFYRFDLTD